MMTARLKFLISISIFVLLYAIYYWVVPLALDIQGNLPGIQKLIRDRYGLNIQVENPHLKMGFTPSVWIDSDALTLIEPDKAKPLYIQKPKIEIQLIPLITGRAHITYFSCDKLLADTKFDKHSKFYLGKYLILNGRTSQLSIENARFDINDYKIKINDELQSKNISLNGDYFYLLQYNSKKHINFSTNTKLRVNEKTSIINADVDYKLPLKKNINPQNVLFVGTITNLDLADFSPYIKTFSKGKIKKTRGTINIETKSNEINKTTTKTFYNVVLDDLAIIGQDRQSSIYVKDKLNLFAIINISKNTLDFKKFNVKSKHIDANITGKMSRINSKHPLYNLSVNVINSRIEDLIELIPATKVNSKNVNLIALKKYGYYADVSCKLAIKGRADKLNIFGKVNSTNGYVIKPPPSDIPKASFDLTFNGKKMYMDILVPTGKKENVDIKGTVNIFNNNTSDIDVLTTPNIDLKFAQEYLVPAHEIFYFDIGPLPIMSISGSGDVKLKIRGNNANPHLFGEFNFRNATMSFNGVNTVINKCFGTLEFKDTNTHFYTKSALIDGKPVKIDGNCTLKGAFSYNAESYNQDLGDLIAILKDSPMLKDYKKFAFPQFASGKSNLSLKIHGKTNDINNIVFGKNIFTEGNIKLVGCNILFEKIQTPIKNLFGNIKFKNTDVDLNISTLLDKSKISLKGTIKDNIANIELQSNSLNIGDILKYMEKDKIKNINYFPSLSKIYISLNARYLGSLDKLDLNKLSLTGKILPSIPNNNNLIVKAGNIELLNSTLVLANVNGSYKHNLFTAYGSIKNILQKNQIINSKFESENFDISALKNITKYPFIPDYARKSLAKFSNYSGHINLTAHIKNNVFHSKIKLNDISLTYVPINLPLKIISGSAEIKNDKLFLYKVNSLVDMMPLLVDGYIDDIFEKPFFNLYINSKPTQKFIEKYINANAIYPLKIKGDIIYSSRIRGTTDLFSAKTEVNMEPDSNIYYMGSTLGDTNNPIRIYLDANISKYFINVDNFQYDKLISSQNNKEFISQQLNAKGRIGINKSNINLHNFRIKTQNPTDAKIFNIIFKKPMVKQGLFTSNVVVNGPISSPIMNGEVNFTGIDMPLWDTTIKDISLDFKDKNIKIKSTGEIFTNKIVFLSTMKNSLTPPYVFENADVYFENLDINAILKSLDKINLGQNNAKNNEQKPDGNISNLVIRNAVLNAENIKVKNINATNLLAKFSLNENLVFSVDDFKFNVANGIAKGNFKYNMLNSNSKLDMSVNNVDANEITVALFDLPNQIYGSLAGEVNLSCNDKTHSTCMQTLQGNGGFEVKDGRMPKLGSLEYLLKASNLLKSGITGLSINSIIDLVTPLKTGQFESIHGDFVIDSGRAHSIQIFSKGKDLSLFLTGTYNFSTLIADMNIFGRLSKKISTILGPIGNASLNTLFNTIPGLHLDEANKLQLINDINKIPGVELSDKMYRIFSVKVYGDINGDKYVQSFKWIE